MTLTVQLPQTNTSPSVHVMGDLGPIDSQCVQNGTQLDCNLGKIKGGKTKTVRVFISLPWSEGSLDFSATAATSTNDSNPGNDSDSAVAEVNYRDRVISGPQHASNRHCTGQGLEAFYECTLFPSSISAHGITFNADGSITFDGNPPGYTGVWGQDYDDQLWFEYSLDGHVVASFEGNAVDADCFEGLTHFPGSAYVAPYEVCLD